VSASLPQLPAFRLDGKRGLVTGAGRGIGLAAAAALAQMGAHVTLCARSPEELDAAVARIREEGGSADALVLDVTDIDRVRDVLAGLPACDVLVNNAGTNRPKPFVDVTPDDYDAVLDLNLRSAFFVAQGVAKRMIAAQVAGSIIHISSQMGHVGGANRSIYCASKWGMEGLNKAMAIDLAAHNIRVNTIAPTFIETPMTAPFFEDAAFRRDVLSRIKLGRLGRVEDLMAAIAYLACDASSMVTGTSLIVDGGWTAE
jgi:NAD(P)-dependent dehydrogenase (short-subunit alcohol dehydrogenase family)